MPKTLLRKAYKNNIEHKILLAVYISASVKGE